MAEPDHTIVARASDVGATRRRADAAFAALSALFVAGLGAQVFLAGAGAFGALGDHSGSFEAHEALGNALGVAAAVLLVLAFVARSSRATVAGAAVLLVLTEAAQHGLASAGHDNRWVGGLHALDALVIVGLSVWLAVAARRRVLRGRA